MCMSILVPKLWAYDHVGGRCVVFSDFSFSSVFWFFLPRPSLASDSHTIMADNAEQKIKKLEKKVTKLEKAKAKLVNVAKRSDEAVTNAIEVGDIEDLGTQ